jgi:hypothetical protein
MKEDRDEQEFLIQVRTTLDSGGDALKASVRSRLTQARTMALEQGRSRPAVRRWLGLGAPLTACLTAGFVAFLSLHTGDGLRNETLADFEIMAAAEPPDFYADLEFYQWLAEGETHAGG